MLVLGSSLITAFDHGVMGQVLQEAGKLHLVTNVFTNDQDDQAVEQTLPTNGQ